MKIIGCYIVKNEAAALRRSIDTIRKQVDEIVVVDTGSTDDTKISAQRAGAKVYDFPWQDDFAAARNFALDKLAGDWVVFLDADEYFSAATAENLRHLIEVQEQTVNLLLIDRQDVDEVGQPLSHLYVPRIFRIREDLRYEGAIHEELRQKGEIVTGIGRVLPEELTLIHTGYAGKLGTEKARRNLTLLLKEMARSQHPERYYGYLAEAYDGLADRANAMKYAYQDIARGRQAETYASRSYRLLLEKLAARKKDYGERLRVAKMAVRDFPELPEFHAELAECLAAGWQYAEAVCAIQRAIELGKNYQGIEPTLFDENMACQCQERKSLFVRLAQYASDIRITACVIAKNEAANIVRWLENANIYANQCLLLDTGSTDDTCKLAAGAEVRHYAWQDDFAAARNKALEYVQGDWVAFLDADEFFAQPEQVRGALAECELLHPGAEAVRLTICNVDADDGMRETSRFCNIRLFRKRAELRYVGKVHENLENITGKAVDVWEEPRLEVIHTGYSSSIVLDKTRRNLTLLQAEIAAQGEKPRHYRYLADCYYALGDYQQAEFYALRAIDAPLKGMGTHGDMYYMVLLCMKALAEPIADQLAFAAAASRQFPAIPDFPAVQGLLCYQSGDYEQAWKLLSAACQLAAERDGQESSAFADMEAMVYAAKADCEARLGNRDEALQDSRQAMGINPEEELALEVFCALRQEAGASALAAELQVYFADHEQQAAFLGRFSERQGFGELYEHYRIQLAERYQQVMPRQDYYQLLQQGDWERLLTRLQKGLAGNLELMVALLLRLERQQGDAYRQQERQLLALLPADAQACWQVAKEQKVIAHRTTYQILWQYVLKYGDDEQVSQWGGLALAEPEIWSKLLPELLEREKWQAALTILAKVPQEEADGAFWLPLGRCLYHLGEYEAAEEAFTRAREMGQDGFLLQSYEKWLKAREKGKKYLSIPQNQRYNRCK